MGRWARKPDNHTSWVALVTPTDRPKSVRNRCLIELFCGVVCVVTCPFDISVSVGAFVIGLGQISSFLSLYYFIKCDNMTFLHLLKVVRDVLRINVKFEPGAVKRNFYRSI